MKACENECREFVAPVQQALYSAPSSSTQTLLPGAAGEPSRAAGRGVAEQLCRQGWGTARRTEDRSTGTWHSPASCPLGFPLLPGKLILTGSTVRQEHLMHVTLMLLELEAGVWALQCTSVPFERNGSVRVQLDSGGKDFAVRCNQVFIIHIEF